jgi:hypothetical protein
MRTAGWQVFFTLLWPIVASGQASLGEAASAVRDQPQLGILCVLPNSSDPPVRTSPGGEYNPATLTVSVDQRAPTRWPHTSPVRIENLTLNDRHLIVLKSDGKRIQSFRFRFSDYGESNLCVAFDGYQGVQLGGGRNAKWCRCW